MKKRHLVNFRVSFFVFAFVLSVFFSLLLVDMFLGEKAFAAPPASPFAPGETLDPTCAPGATNCTVQQVYVSTTTGNFGIGTTSPYAKLSVVGEIVGAYFTGTTSATSTFFGGVQANALSITSINASSTFANGINLSGGCFAVNGTCLSSASQTPWTSNINGGGFNLSNAGSITGTFFNATSTTATSTFAGGFFVGTSTPNFYIDRITGKVGVGTSTLPHALTVIGNISASGNYRIGSSTVLTASSTARSVFAGFQAGSDISTGLNNSFFGHQAGSDNSTGFGNTFLGETAGTLNTSGGRNTFVGGGVGTSNTTASRNTFIGYHAGQNSNADSNVFIGDETGDANTTGSGNLFLGNSAGGENTTGNNNVLLGYQAGDNLTSGSNNIVLGYDIDAPSVTSANTLNIGNLLFGMGLDGSGTTLSSGNVGIGTTSPFAKLSIAGIAGGTSNLFVISSSTAAFATSTAFIIDANGNVGIGTTSPSAQLSVQGNTLLAGTLTVLNTSTSTFSDGLQANTLSITSTTATSTFANGLNVTGGCYAVSGTCLVSGSTSVGAGTTGQLPYYAGVGNVLTATSSIFLATSGNVGIGTTSPYAKLSVVGEIVAQKFTATSTTATSTFMGAVGIGTTTPSEKLTVVGNIQNTYPASGLNPTLRGSASTGTGPRDVYVSGRYAYVVASSTLSTLQVFDVSTSSPALISSVNTGAGSGPVSVYVSGRYAYVVNTGTDNLQIYDVSNPSSLVLVGFVSTGSGPTSIYVSGRYAYVVNDGPDTLEIFDVSNPSSPIRTGSVGVGGGIPNSVHVSGRYAYVTNRNSLRIFDISNPSNPVLVNSVSTGNDPVGVYVSGRYAYVLQTDAPDRLVIFDISNPANPILLPGSVNFSTDAASIFVSGRYAYVTTGDEYLVVIDVSNPSAPVIVGSGGLNAFLEFTVSVFVSGRYAYVVNTNLGNNLQVFDISGIETTSAIVHSLEAGNLQVRNDIIAQGQLQVTGGLNVGTGGIFSAGALSVGSSSNPTSAFFGGNVGIGTTSPFAKLSIAGHPGGTTNLFAISTSTAGFATSTAFIIDANGKVGIGTTTPSAQLALFGLLYVGGSGTSTIENNLNVMGQLKVGTTSIFLNGSATSTFTQGLNISGGCYAVNGTCITSGGSGSVNAGTAGQIAYYEGTGSALNGTSTLFLTPTGNVGIGTTTPYAKLSVTNIGTAPSFIVEDSASPDTTPFIIDASGNVGIGTTVLSGGKLTVEGDINITSVDSYNISGSSVLEFSGTTVRLNSIAAGNVSIPQGNVGIGTTSPYAKLSVWGTGTGTGQAFSVTNNASTSLLTVLDNGNVGIGTTTPEAKLYIAKEFSASESAIVINQRSASASVSAIQWLNYTGTQAGGGAIKLNADSSVNFASSMSFETYSGAAIVEGIRINNIGNVGIGTTTPWRTLSVTGKVAFDGLSANLVGDGALCLSTDKEVRVNTGSNTCTLSSERFKHNIVSYTGGLDLVRQIRPVSFDLNTDNSSHLGMIAEEVNLLDPRLVFYDQDGTTPRGIRYEEFTAVLAGAIQELATTTAFISNSWASTTPLLSIDASGNLSFGTTSVFSINSSGLIGIGTTTPEYKLHVIGDVAATSFVNISTKTSKKDITYLTEADNASVLEKIKNLTVASYHYTMEDASSPMRIGLIAEEAPAEILSASGKGVDIYKLSTFILSGVKAQQKQIEELDSRVTRIESLLAISTSTPSASTSSPQATLSFLESLGTLITQGLASFKDLIAEKVTAALGVFDSVETYTLKTKTAEFGNVTIKNENLEKTGVTIYDRVTGQPICMYFENSVLRNQIGECDTSNTSSTTEPTPSPTPDVTATPTPTPDPATTPEPTPEVTLEPTPEAPIPPSEVISEPTPEPTAEVIPLE